jgi:hypothetical protein
MRKRRERDGQKESRWREMMRRQAESGKSVRGYCRQAGIRESAFYWWRRELARRSQHGEHLRQLSAVGRRQARGRPPARKPAGVAAEFLPLRVMTERRREEGCSIEIQFGEGRTLRIPAGFARQTLLDVLGVLEEQGC